MKGNCQKILDEIERRQCGECGGSGEVNDAELGDISFNKYDCEECDTTGWKDGKVRHLITPISYEDKEQ